jgi:hypothetical protein
MFITWIRFEIVISLTNLFVPSISLAFIPVVLYLLIPDIPLVPNKDRSSPDIFPPDAYSEGRSLSGFVAFWRFDESLMPDCGQGFVKVAGYFSRRGRSMP